MKLSTKGKYGLLAIYDLAVNGDKPVAIKAIAQRQGISDSYLEQLFASLKKADLIKSKRGSQGGYQLTRAPDKISIGEILLALEGSVSVTDCVATQGCGNTCLCPSRPVFHKIQEGIDSILSELSLADMLEDSENSIDSVNATDSENAANSENTFSFENAADIENTVNIGNAADGEIAVNTENG